MNNNKSSGFLNKYDPFKRKTKEEIAYLILSFLSYSKCSNISLICKNFDIHHKTVKSCIKDLEELKIVENKGNENFILSSEDFASKYLIQLEHVIIKQHGVDRVKFLKRNYIEPLFNAYEYEIEQKIEEAIEQEE